MIKSAIFLVAVMMASSVLTYGAANAQITGRTVPGPIYGVTFDDVGSVNAKVTSLSNIAKVPTVRVVFDKGTGASNYKTPIQRFRPEAYVMGELIDSSYMKGYTVSGVQTWTNSYVNTLGSLVDIWEIGNEVNGDWLGGNVMAKIEAMYDIVSAQGGRTALTFFYEGETTESNNCIDSQGGMFPWIQKNFLNSPTTETEKIRLGVNYVLISWYPDQCRGENPDWASVYTKLAGIFPNSKVGFGELGTANPQRGSAYEKNEIMTYYPMGNTVAGLPASFIGGYFWWYAAEEMVPWPGSLGTTLNAALAAGP
jgi:hypothetical protein